MTVLCAELVRVLDNTLDANAKRIITVIGIWDRARGCSGMCG